MPRPTLLQSFIFLVPLVCSGCLETPDLVPATVDEDPTLPAVDLNGTRFHLVQRGAPTGIPIIFLAGGPGNDALYLQRLGDPCDGVDLGATHPLYFWDQRGAGRSRRHSDSLLRLDVFEADLDALVEYIDPMGNGVILVGHSWGGMLATSFLNRNPERVAAVVLLEPGEYSSDIWDRWERESGAESSFGFSLGSEWLNDFAWSGQILTLHDHDALDFAALIAAQNAQPERQNRETAPNDRLGGAVIRRSFLGGFYPDSFDFTTNLDAYSTEVLVIAGDTPTSDLGVDFQEFQIDVFPSATLEVIPNAGHTDVVWADACTTVALMNDYFQRVEVSP